MNFTERYQKTVVPALKEAFGFRNALAVPRITKAVINVGIPATEKDGKLLEAATKTLERITGQKPVRTLAKKSIASFKVRSGMVVGLKVTLRGKRMRDFIDKLINLALPRSRDFRGIDPSAVDARGNLAIGFKEQIGFPEIHSDEVDRFHGLEVALVTNAARRDVGLGLWKALGIPFKQATEKKKEKKKKVKKEKKV